MVPSEHSADDVAEPAKAPSTSTRRWSRVPPWVRQRLEDEKHIEVGRDRAGLNVRPTRAEQRRLATQLAKRADDLRREAATRSNSTDIPF